MSVNSKRILRIAEVEELTGLNRRTIYRYIKDNAFPSPMQMGMRTVGWMEQDILGWINNVTESNFRQDHLEGDVWVTYKKERSPMDVKVGDIVGQVTVRKVEYRE